MSNKDPLQDALAKLDADAEKLAKERVVAKKEQTLKVKEKRKAREEKKEADDLEKKLARDDSFKSKLIFIAAAFIVTVLIVLSYPPAQRAKALEYSIYIIGCLSIVAMKAKKH